MAVKLASVEYSVTSSGVHPPYLLGCHSVSVFIVNQKNFFFSENYTA